MDSKIISRNETIISEQFRKEILQKEPKGSIFMSKATRLPDMTSNQTKMTVIDMFPMAYWVNGDTGFKQISRQNWDNVYMEAAELAVIIPISENVANDADFDIFGQVTPRAVETFYKKVDEAIIFGIDKPVEWRNDIITAARQAGNNVPCDNTSDLRKKLLGKGGVFSKLWDFGYNPNAVISSMQMKSELNDLVDANGRPIYSSNMQGTTPYALDGIPMTFPENGSFDTSVARMIVGDFSQAVYSIREDVQVKILTEASIVDPRTKETIFALAQQDMIALRIKFRMGWALPNPATRLDENRTSCPFAYLEPPMPVTTHEVKFTVTNGTDPIGYAVVDVNGSRLVTDDSGVATFHLRSGTYPCKVKAEDYKPVSETVVVGDTDVSRSVTLISNNPAVATTASARAAKAISK